MLDRLALVHYHEIGLKGHNRATFENRLRVNLDSIVAGLTAQRARRMSSRLVVPMSDPDRADEILERIARVPGVSYVADVTVTERDLGAIERAALEAIRRHGPFETYGVVSRRSNTDFPVPSNEINIAVGRYIGEHTDGRVNLSAPDVTVNVDVVQGEALVYAKRLEGIGGLPVGTAGKVVALVSAGIDSPVAAWRIMKRGAVVVGVHFTGEPHTTGLSSRIAEDIGHVLEQAEGFGRLYTVRFGDLQREISLEAPPALRVLLYRRLMFRVAEAIAAREGARALVTGESLGQVASQTLENIAAVDRAATMPVLRPLIGMDKNEIIRTARFLGTYELSIQSHDDCCTLFMPRMPATRASVEELDAAEAALDVDRMVADALAGVTHTGFRCPAYRPPRAPRLPRPDREPEGA